MHIMNRVEENESSKEKKQIDKKLSILVTKIEQFRKKFYLKNIEKFIKCPS